MVKRRDTKLTLLKKRKVRKERKGRTLVATKKSKIRREKKTCKQAIRMRSIYVIMKKWKNERKCVKTTPKEVT